MNQPTVEWQPVGYASALQRGMALLVDCLVFLPLNLLSQYNALSIKSFPLVILIALAWWTYKPLMEWRYGATLGKMAIKIRVLNERMQSISLNQALLRFSPYFAMGMSTLIANFNLFHTPGFMEASTVEDFRNLNQPMGDASILLGTAFIYLFAITPIFFDDKKQALYDKLSQTYCIAVQPILGPDLADPSNPE